MLRLESDRGVQFCDGLTRRDFLRVGSLAAGLGLAELAGLQRSGAAGRSDDRACIQLFLVGGPSQLDTWDPKPVAPDGIRGPFRAIPTNVPGISICEPFPLMAQMADRYAIVRSVHHEEAPIHETGHQLLQTGGLSPQGQERPHFGSVLGKLRPGNEVLPNWVVTPGPITSTGVNISHGQSAGFLGRRYEPFHADVDPVTQDVSLRGTAPDHDLNPGLAARPRALVDAVDAADRLLERDAQLAESDRGRALAQLTSPAVKRAFDLSAEPESIRDRYGRNQFGQSCLLARRLVQHGVRLVTVNMFDTVFGQITWDCHANGGDLSSTLEDYRDILGPMFDRAYTALLDDLLADGLLDSTLVAAMGEFGRTPRLNNRGGRDHWPSVWSVILAGGGVRGGQIVGSSDRHGEEPRDRPVHAAEIAATVYHSLGIDPTAEVPGADGRPTRLLRARPVLELF
jgi:uncharacterized protein (DUF1501 family)